MSKFQLYSIYNIYVTSRPNYNYLMSDSEFLNVTSTQLRAFNNALLLGIKDTLLGRTIDNLFKSYTGKELWDRLFHTIAYMTSSSSLSNKLIGNNQTGFEYHMVVKNMQNIYIEISNQSFNKMDPITKSILINYNLVSQGNIQPVENAVFTTLSPEESALYHRTGVPVYSGVDIELVFLTPHVQVMGNVIKLLSFSSHTDKVEVRTLGRSSAKGFTNGGRTIAGTIIANLSINDPLMSLHPEWFDPDISKNISFGDMFKPYLLTDQLPLFDILVLLESETGFTSAFTIFGVTIPDHGMVMSIDDSTIEITYQYKAKDFDIVREISLVEDPVTGRRIDPLKSAEYLMRREMVMKGKSAHEGVLSVAQKWEDMWNILEEMEYLKQLM